MCDARNILIYLITVLYMHVMVNLFLNDIMLFHIVG